jgi:hypothetical protein
VVDDAEAGGDPERAARAREELEFIARELAAAYGLGGAARRLDDPAERARKAVRNRIRDALARIEASQPALGRHLRASIRTGSFCSCQPERPSPGRSALAKLAPPAPSSPRLTELAVPPPQPGRRILDQRRIVEGERDQAPDRRATACAPPRPHPCLPNRHDAASVRRGL